MKLEMGIAYDNRSGAGIQGRSGHSKDGTGHRRRPDRPARPRNAYVDRHRELRRVEDRNSPAAVHAWRAPHVSSDSNFLSGLESLRGRTNYNRRSRYVRILDGLVG